MEKLLKLVISYSNKDSEYCRLVREALEPISKQVDIWYAGYLQPAEDYLATIKEKFSSADIYLLLITPNFLESDFIRLHELYPAVQNARDGSSKILSVVLEDTPSWDQFRYPDMMDLKLGRFQYVKLKEPKDKNNYVHVRTAVLSCLNSIKDQRSRGAELEPVSSSHRAYHSNKDSQASANDSESGKFTDDDKQFLISELKEDFNLIGGTTLRRTFCADIGYPPAKLGYLSAENNTDENFAKQLIRDLIIKKRADCLGKICVILSGDRGVELVQRLDEIKAKLDRPNPF